jgi:mono/diheme cytochrome c family protein
MCDRSCVKEVGLRWRPVMALLLFVAGYGGGIAAAYGQAPTVTLAAPPGTTVNRTVALTATPTAAGVTSVEFLVDGTVIGAATAAPYTANWDTSTSADGVHSLTARVTDAANAVATSAPVSVTVNNNPVINLFLTPDEVFPRPTSTASGLGQLTFNLITGAVTGGVSLTGVTATLAHIHQAYAGANGPIIINFAVNATDPNRWEPVAESLLTADQVTDLLAGKLYVNVHSAAFPDGEIRSQIKPADVTVVFTSLNGASVVPPVTTSAGGVGATTMDVKTSLASVHLNVTGADDATEAHVHIGAPGTNAATALLSLTKDAAAPGHWSVEQQAIAEADRAAFSANTWYLDVHTPASPGGLLRGQITLPGTLTQIQTSVFTPRCAVCHTGGGSFLPASLNLTSGAATFASLVNVASEEQPALMRVKLFDPANSYLIHKLEGATTITGSRMPLGGPFLDQATIDQVKSWIASGAPNN